MASDTLFRQKAPGIMALLMQDFALDEESAAAILGNLGHESGGFRFLQEKQPLIPGSAGGYGWAQWTGPRRRAFEAYVQRNGFDPASDTANYKWLFNELKGYAGSEEKAIPAVKNAVGLENKVEAFELAFERAGIKHYESRNEWAEKALNAYRAGGWEPLKIADAETPRTDPVILPPLQPGQIDMNQILSVALPLLLQALANRQTGGTAQPQLDIAALLAALLGQQPKPALPPPAPPPVVVETKAEPKTSVGVGLIGLLGSIIGMTTGTIGTPFGMGEAPTTAGTLSVVIPAAISAIGATGIFGPFGAILGRIAGAAFSAAKAPK